MTTTQAEISGAAIGVGITDRPENLSVIQKPGCAAAIWRRQIPSDVQSWINGLAADALPSARLVLRPDAVSQALHQLCDSVGLAECAQRKWMTADISAMAVQFADLMQAPFLRMRLDIIETNACRKFHIDAITARLICTYRGTGTQYGISTDGAEPKRVFTVPTGSPMVMRGTLWPEDPKSGMMHRSPPIEGTGETRFVLVLDPVFDLEDVEDGCG